MSAPRNRVIGRSAHRVIGNYSKSEMGQQLWQNLPDHVRIALEKNGATWSSWKTAGEFERWHMLRRALGD